MLLVSLIIFKLQKRVRTYLLYVCVSVWSVPLPCYTKDVKILRIVFLLFLVPTGASKPAGPIPNPNISLTQINLWKASVKIRWITQLRFFRRSIVPTAAIAFSDNTDRHTNYRALYYKTKKTKMIKNEICLLFNVYFLEDGHMIYVQY